MQKTYKAILRGDRVEWLGPAPDTNGGANVEITVVHPEEDSLDERRRKIHEALEGLVASGAWKLYGDPVEWQREIRKDRPLPGRED